MSLGIVMKEKAGVYGSLIILCISLFTPVSAQSADSLYKQVAINKAYLKSYVLDTRDIVLSPLLWNTSQWLGFAAVTSSAALLSTQDLALKNFIQRNTTPLTNTLEKQGFERWGSGAYSLPLMGAFYLYGSLAKDARSKRVALLGTKAFVVSALIVTPVKQLIHRHRPNISNDPYQINGPFTPGTNFSSAKGMWDGFTAGKHYTSLPSGHTMTAFVMATIVATEYKDKPWVPIVAYSVASLTGLSRMEANKHWASDVLMGAAFGYAMGKLVCFRNNWGLTMAPVFAGHARGAALSLPLR